MRSLAELAFDYIWLSLFGNEQQIDADFSVKLQEELALILPNFTPEEQDALAEVAKATKARLLAEPDSYGYTPRSFATEQQMAFLDSVIDKDIYGGFPTA